MLIGLLPIPMGGANSFGRVGFFTTFCGALFGAIVYYLSGAAWLRQQFDTHRRGVAWAVLLTVVAGLAYLIMYSYIDTPQGLWLALEVILRTVVCLPLAFAVAVAAALIVDRFWPRTQPVENAFTCFPGEIKLECSRRREFRATGSPAARRSR